MTSERKELAEFARKINYAGFNVDTTNSFNIVAKEEATIASPQQRQTKTYSDVLDNHYKKRLLKW